MYSCVTDGSYLTMFREAKMCHFMNNSEDKLVINRPIIFIFPPTVRYLSALYNDSLPRYLYTYYKQIIIHVLYINHLYITYVYSMHYISTGRYLYVFIIRVFIFEEWNICTLVTMSLFWNSLYIKNTLY